MNTQTLLNNVATINKDNGIFVNAKEFLKELRQVATAVAKPSDHRPNLTFVHVRVTENNLILFVGLRRQTLRGFFDKLRL